MVRDALNVHHVVGAEDLGRFMSNTEFFRPSALDERAAMPVFLALLPRVSDPKVVGAMAGHLRRPWARPTAFAPLYIAFERWAESNPLIGWGIGDALVNAATKSELESLLGIVTQPKFAIARQMIVDALWRFRAAPEVASTLVSLIDDPDVALHAMSALRRTVGARDALPYLIRVRDEHAGNPLGATATKQVRKAETALLRQTN